MIDLLELYPDHLNLNGDRANLLVLQRRLEWAGFSVKRSVHRTGEDLSQQRPDFVLIGHGSKAAWRQIYLDLKANSGQLNAWFDQGVLGLAVSSGHAALHGLIDGFELNPQKIERVSKFEISNFEDQEILGYLNSELDLPVIEKHREVIATQLHGPLLAKNPILADGLIAKLLARHGHLSNTPNQEKFELVDKLVAEIWKLERDMAND